MPVNLEAAARGGRNRSQRLTPEQRREAASRAGRASAAAVTPEAKRRRSLASAISQILNRADQINENQRNTISDAISPIRWLTKEADWESIATWCGGYLIDTSEHETILKISRAGRWPLNAGLGDIVVRTTTGEYVVFVPKEDPDQWGDPP